MYILNKNQRKCFSHAEQKDTSYKDFIIPLRELDNKELHIKVLNTLYNIKNWDKEIRLSISRITQLILA